MIYSAGIIPFRLNDDQEVEFFVGHPGGLHNERRDYWNFLKGGVKDNECWEAGALREFKEETGVDLSEERENLIPLGMVEQNPSKTAVAYGIYYPEIDPNECRSNIADDGVSLEIDRYRWMTFNQLKYVTHATHLTFYSQIIDIVNSMVDDE